MSDDTVVEGDLFIGESTYIKGKWVREQDYVYVQQLADARADQIRRLDEEVSLLQERLFKIAPPVIASVIERHEDKGIDFVKQIVMSHWGPDGVHVVIR